MPHNRLATALERELATLQESGRAKGAETVIQGIIPSRGDYGPRTQRWRTCTSVSLG